eukprot:4834501-Prymnesium_polylepis.1
MVTTVSMVAPVRRNAPSVRMASSPFNSSAPRLPPGPRSPGKPRGLPESSAYLRWTDGLSKAVVGTTWTKPAAFKPAWICLTKRSMSPV